jgi:glycosyltransferase involved in cell wall biosynthesis
MTPHSGRPLFFYSGWPIDYHNQEASRKAYAFADAGYDVVYVAGIGTRNPRLSSARKLLDRAGRKLRPQVAPGERGVRSAALAVAPPRQLRPIRRLNTAWVERQLEQIVPRWGDAVAWIRQPTPELVDALARLQPAAVVYECVDAHHVSPGMTGRWREIFDSAQRALAEIADVVVVTSESLEARFSAWGADVRYVPHGVDLFPWREPPAKTADDLTLGYLGVLDGRLDAAVLRSLAARPGWRIRLVGPVERGFDPRAVAGYANVSIEPPVPHADIGERLAEFDVGIMPYAESPVYAHMSPLKNLELMAAGKPAVARPTPALDRFSDLLYFARTPEEFVAQVERAAREDSPELARRRRAVAESHDWSQTLQTLRDLLEQLVGGPHTVPRDHLASLCAPR